MLKSTSQLMVSLLLCAAVQAQEPALAPNAPKDRPFAPKSVQTFEQAIAPHVAQAKATYPQAKERFLRGLPKGESFFLTTKIYDLDGKFEQVFVAVQSIKDGQVVGRVWSQPQLVTRYRYKDQFTFPEDRLVDWLISKPDGSEQGNFVGKFLDTYQQR